MDNGLNIDGTVETFAHGEMTVAEAARLFEISGIVKRYGQWVVTEYGLECLVIQYSIPKGRLNEQNWISHMSDKRWVNIEEFEAALNAAKEYHKTGPEITAIPDLPAPPGGTIKGKPFIDYYAATKLKYSLLGMHETYNAIANHVPENLPRPKAAPETFSVKEDAILGPAYTAFAYGIDGFLAALDRLYLLNERPLYGELLNYTYKQFEKWLSQVLSDAF